MLAPVCSIQPHPCAPFVSSHPCYCSGFGSPHLHHCFFFLQRVGQGRPGWEIALEDWAEDKAPPPLQPSEASDADTQGEMECEGDPELQVVVVHAALAAVTSLTCTQRWVPGWAATSVSLTSIARRTLDFRQPERGRNSVLRVLGQPGATLPSCLQHPGTMRLHLPCTPKMMDDSLF